MDLYPLIKDLESFLQGKCDGDNILDRVQILEDELIDFELDSEKRDLVGRDNIISLMDILDSINLLFEEAETIEQEEIEYEMSQLIKIQKVLLDKSLVEEKKDAYIPAKESRVSRAINKPFIETGTGFVTGMKGSIASENASFQTGDEQAPPRFAFHPEMNNKLPFQSLDKTFSDKGKPFIPPPSKFEFSNKAEIFDEELPSSGDLSDINLKSSPLYHLLNTCENYSIGKANLLDFQDKLERTILDLEELKNEILEHSSDSEVREDFVLIIEEILEELSYIGESLENRNLQSELNDFIELLDALNHKFLGLNKKFYSQETGEKEIIEAVMSRISEDEYLTSNYQLIKVSSEKFLNSEIEENELQNIIDDMLDLLKSCRAEYEDTYISPEEWTLEVATGDKILLEGLEEWEKGLQDLTGAIQDQEKEKFRSAINLVYEANKKLVINQHLALYVKEQANLMDKYKELKIPGAF